MNHQDRARWLTAVAAATLTVTALTACGGDDDAPAPIAEETRPQDSRTFTPANPNATTFDALKNGTAATDATSRWAGVLNGASYIVEVPPANTWNGKLVMYAHGYAGTGPALGVSPDLGMRRHLLSLGYAWAASSYSKNYYDVRAGIEDTNALALEFVKIAAANGRTVAAPTKTFIVGHSMGGHIAAAAVEAETAATAVHKVKYHGAVPMCGVVGDTELFDYLAAAQVTAQAIAGQAQHPLTGWAAIKDAVTAKLYTTFPSAPTADGLKYASVMQNLTGGPRPMFDIGFIGTYTGVVWSTFGGDGTVNGIYNKFGADTNRFSYVIDGDTAGSAALNASAQKLTAAADYNRLRTDGLRWVPKVNGDINVPVVSLHTLGDMYVPFSMEQIYQKRVAAKGNTAWLVQRAIRGVAHCDFTIQEQTEAFDAMTAWEAGGAKPAGDDVVTPGTVAATSYGCAFTRNTTGVDDSTAIQNARAALTVARPCP
jgi:pimeloyl-ACP methyl ester carboxylesterase